MMKICYYDALILGSGLAGLTLALELSNMANVAVMSKNNISNAASYKAQGGIAATVSQDDRFQYHIADTINAGDGLCDLKAVEFFIEQGPQAIEWLTKKNISFDRLNDLNQSYDLHHEGGHTKRRILHIRDETGKHIVKTLHEHVQKNTRIHCLNDCMAIDVLVHENTCVGCVVFDKKLRTVNIIIAKIVVIATGGASAVYDKTSNEMAIGDGIAMAYQAGCRIKDMEFCQFHPTCFNTKTGVFLISETLRGEGGRLTLPSTSEQFMHRYDERVELAPRDIVARAMTLEMKKYHLEYINLDISHRPSSFIKTHFPKIYDICLQNGIDITHEPIPVFPAAHYTCGGVAVDLAGQTDLKNLFAIGEVACTGLHGANRLASNSLLECIVSALNGAKKIKAILPNLKYVKNNKIMLDRWTQKKGQLSFDGKKWVSRIKKIMWQNVGIIRSNQSLLAAKTELMLIKNNIEKFFENTVLTPALVELRNLADVAYLVVESAILRKESRGTHFNTDYAFNLFM